MEKRDTLTRRDFLAVTGATAGTLVLAKCGGESGIGGAETANGSKPLELLVTEMPVHLYNDREVLDSATIDLADLTTARSFAFVGAKPEHQYLVDASAADGFFQLHLEIVLEEDIWKTVDARYSLDRPLRRLWLSRGYLHDEERTTACFPAPIEPQPFESEVWFATFSNADRALLEETTRPFEYAATDGRVRLDLHDDYRYTREWSTHDDGIGHDYLSRFLRGDQVMTEIRESVAGLDVMRDRACTGLASASYCDRDDI